MSADVIIPFHGRADLMRRCLATFADRSVFRGRLLLVDDGSPPADARAVRAIADRLPLPIEWIATAQRHGFVRAVNAAFARCRHDVGIVLNNDTAPTQAMLAQLAHSLALHSSLGAVAPASDNPADLYQYRAAPPQQSGDRPRLTLVPYLTAMCLAVRRRALGGPLFDEVFSPGYFEDLDLSCQLRARGWQLAVLENARIHHAGRATFGSDPALATLIARNYGVFQARWGRAPDHAELDARLSPGDARSGATP
jgi:GT2 family glycosyltransferase